MLKHINMLKRSRHSNLLKSIDFQIVTFGSRVTTRPTWGRLLIPASPSGLRCTLVSGSEDAFHPERTPSHRQRAIEWTRSPAPQSQEKLFPKCELPHTSRPIPERCCLRAGGSARSKWNLRSGFLILRVSNWEFLLPYGLAHCKGASGQ
jgi:hypothetical protein